MSFRGFLIATPLFVLAQVAPMEQATAAQPVPPRIANLSVSQRPGTFYVDIGYDLIDPDSDIVGISVQVSGDGGATYNVPVTVLSGDLGFVKPGPGKKIVWIAWNDWPDQFTTRGRVRLIANDTKNAVVPPPFPAPRPDLVWIPPGTFTMGSPASEGDRFDWEGPQTRVYLSKGFFMGKYEVTQHEYLAVVGSNPSYFTGDLGLPVEQVSWYDAVAYCNRLTANEANAGMLPVGYVYRLPTEAEWEYACRAGTTTRFSYGEDPGYSELGRYAWFGANSGGRTHPVGQLLPNPWGLYDLHGNVWEWCQDWWSGNLVGGSVTDPWGAASGSDRVVRGGTWGYAGLCRSASRSRSTPDYRINGIGFRVVLAPGQ